MERFPSFLVPKVLMDKSLTDSGYTSELSKASESQLSHQSREASAIEEDIEIDENQQPPTPTTRNLQKFSALQLTTPKSNSPLKKRPSSIDDQDNVTPKKAKFHEDDFETPKKEPFGRKRSFRERLQSDHKSPALSPISSNVSKSASKILGENQFENLSSTPIKGGFRPDFYVETVENMGWNPLLPRSRSPKLKRKLLKKIQSFSPRKFQVSKGFGKRFQRCPSPIPIDDHPQKTTSAEETEVNPAHGIIAFNVQQFEDLLNAPKHSSSNEDIKVENNNVAAPPVAPSAIGFEVVSLLRQQSSALLETVEEEEIDWFNPIPLSQISSQSIREYFHEMKSKTEDSIVEETKTSGECSKRFKHKNSLDLFDLNKQKEEVKPLGQTNEESEDQNEEMDISLTPTSNMTIDEKESTKKSLKRSVKHLEYSPSVLQKPKKVRRSISFQYSSDEEKHRILYPSLTGSTPKKRAKKSLDYTTKDKTPSPAKKRLDYSCSGERRTTPRRRFQPPKRNSYEGATTLNILSRLAGTLPALDRIFSYLQGKDLHSVYNVCSDWRRIVDEHHQARSRLEVYQQELIPIKENKCVKEKIEGKRSSERILCDHNTLSDDQLRQMQERAERSPPTSPSTRKFREHQKFLQRLDDQAKVVHCPKCFKSSLIMSPRRQKRCARAITNHRVSPMKRSPARRTLFKPNTTICAIPSVRPEHKMLGIVGKSQSLPENLSTFELELCTKNRSLISDGIQYETYAICSRESCRFTFCISCLRERHEVGKCVEFEPLSPMKAEEEFKRRIVPGSKRSRKNLKRL